MSRTGVIRMLIYCIPAGYFAASSFLPFWGDAVASISKPALNIYQNGLASPWNLPDADPGHPTLFPWIIALLWLLFGKSLWIVHLLVALCSLALMRVIELFCRSILPGSLQVLALALTSISPLFVSQATGISLQLPLALLFLWSAWFLRRNKVFPAVLLMCLMILVHLQALFFLGILFLFDAWKKVRWSNVLSYIPRAALFLLPFSVFAGWAWFHMEEFGWVLITPNYTRASPDLRQTFYNYGIAAWRLIDFGYIAVVPFAFISALRLLRKRITNDAAKLFLLCFLVLVFVLPAIFAYPPNHRYFFPVFLLAVPLFLQQISRWKPKHIVASITSTLFLFIAGNFMYYPGKCLGDANLAYLSFFEAEDKVVEALGNDLTIHSFAPLNNSSEVTWLKERAIDYRQYYSGGHTADVLLQSNLTCEFGDSLKTRLKKDYWEHSFGSGAVYLTVFLHKGAAEQKWPHLQFDKVREPGWMENQVSGWRKRLRGGN